MAGVQTSRITTTTANDLTIQPASGKKTLLKSVDSTNPGLTPLATDSTGAVDKLTLLPLDSSASPSPDDLLMISDIGGANEVLKRVSIGGIKLDWNQIENKPDGSAFPSAPEDGTFYGRSNNTGNYGTGSGDPDWHRVIPYDISKLPLLP